MSSEGEKEPFENVRERKLSYAEVQHVEGYSVPVMPETETTGRPINLLLIVACVAFGCSSFLFGFDNNVIGPIVALKPFVSDIPERPQLYHIIKTYEFSNANLHPSFRFKNSKV